MIRLNRSRRFAFPPALSASKYARAAKQFREQRYLFLKGILPPPLLEYLKVYYAILLADNYFSTDSQCPSSLSLSGDPAFDEYRRELVRVTLSDGRVVHAWAYVLKE